MRTRNRGELTRVPPVSLTRRAVTAAALVGSAVGCDPAPTVHLEPGSRPDSVLFHVYEGTDSLHAASELSELTVRRCASEHPTNVMWDLTRVGGDNRRRIIRYGERPDIYWRVHREPKPLTEGCYVVTVRTFALPSWHRIIVEGDSVTPSYGAQ
jgi:hypothetical protein